MVKDIQVALCLQRRMSICSIKKAAVIGEYNYYLFCVFDYRTVYWEIIGAVYWEIIGAETFL